LSAIKAQNAYEEALEIRRTLAKTNPDAYLSEMAMALNNLGSLYYSNNAHTKAQNAYRPLSVIATSDK
jgi:tetratricopeptide (TPR) repeat protein